MARHTHNIYLNDTQEAMLQEILATDVYDMQEMFREKLREVHAVVAAGKKRKETKPKKSKPEEPEDNGLTPEEHCVRMLDGVVVGDSCLVKWPSGLEHKVALFRVKEFASREDLPI